MHLYVCYMHKAMKSLKIVKYVSIKSAFFLSKIEKSLKNGGMKTRDPSK